MKKINKSILSILTMIICFSIIAFNNKVEADGQKPQVYAHAYVVMDAKTGEVLHSQDMNKKIYPASTTKMLTALVALDNCSLSKKITIKQSVLDNTPSIATQAGLKVGYTYTVEELLNMLLVYSAADAANSIANEVGGSIPGFVNMMNQKAKSLGMTGSHFDNPIGLDGRNFPNTYSTGSDIAKLTQQAMKNQTIKKIVKKPYYTIKNYYNGSSKTLNCSNKFLRGQYYPRDLYTVIGTKTGTTDAAGNVLSTTAIDKNGREIICSFFGNNTRAKMYEDIEALLTYTYKDLNSGWKKENGKWCYLDNNGKKKVGWLKDKDSWYYLKSNGEMATSWLKYNNNWYYLEQSGAMRTGWLKYFDGWYYLREDGSMKIGWLKYNNNWYYLENDGSMRTGWLKHSDKWYYLREDGSMKIGWLKYNNNWYYMSQDGSMLINANIDGWNIDHNGIATMAKSM